MNWKELLKFEVESAFAVTEKLLDRMGEQGLEWKPASGGNWMTTGQLLKHLAESCGAPFRGFATGDWGLPEGVDLKDLKPDEMLPPADKLPSVSSVEEARQMLRRDKQLALEILAGCTEERLTTQVAPAPWDPTPLVLGHRLLQMVEHLKSHKAQLFYYLKLQGVPVNTGDLWGA